MALAIWVYWSKLFKFCRVSFSILFLTLRNYISKNSLALWLIWRILWKIVITLKVLALDCSLVWQKYFIYFIYLRFDLMFIGMKEIFYIFYLLTLWLIHGFVWIVFHILGAHLGFDFPGAWLHFDIAAPASSVSHYLLLSDDASQL